MKKFARRLTALALALALTAGAAGQTVFASWALGTELVERTTELAKGVSLTTQKLWSASKSDLRTENYITYTPGHGVTPMVYSGTYVTSRNMAAAAASNLEKQGYQVIAGINGGFFNSDGTIVGMLMTEGVVRALDVYNWTLLGFTKDGTVFIDESRITKTVSWEREGVSSRYDLSGFNAYRHSDALGGLYLYNQDFSSKVNCDTSRGCVAVVLTPDPDDWEAGDDAEPSKPDDGETGDDAEPSEPGGEDIGDDAEPPKSGGENTGDDAEPPKSGGGDTGEDTEPPESGGEDTGDDPQTPAFNGDVTMNGMLTLFVREIMDTKAGDTFNGQLTDGRYMLYANYYNGNDGLLGDLRSLTPGQQVTVTVSGVSEQWTDAVCGISGRYTLLRDGKIVSDLPPEANPYSAVGVREDGAAVFYTIDGRQSGYSVGASYEQVAQRLQELGCVAAVALDGGGSTVLGAALPGQQKFGLVNQPSQTNRAVNNFIFLVAEDEYAGMDPGFYLSSDTQVVLAGASLNVSAAGYDQWGKAASDMTPEWSATGGTIEGDGLTAVYTAGDTAGAYAVSAGFGSKLPVQVVRDLSRLTVTMEGGAVPVSSLSLQALDEVDLSASGRWRNLNVAMEDEDVTWEVSGDIGTIDTQGLFTAGRTNATGEITASAGGRTVTISVTVEVDCPFGDIADHWSEDYVIRLYRLGITQGIGQPDGTYIFYPAGKLSRGELLAFITRLLHVDTDEYEDVTLPFEDADTIPEWMLPSIKAMYALCVLNGSGSGGKLYANVNSVVSREEAMTMLGRVLADQVSEDLSDFDDSDLVSDWARSYVETLVGLNVVQGSGGKLSPGSDITRGEAAKLLVEIDGLEKAELSPRPTEPEPEDPETEDPETEDPETEDPETEDPEIEGPETDQTPIDPDGGLVGPSQSPDQTEGD